MPVVFYFCGLFILAISGLAYAQEREESNYDRYNYENITKEESVALLKEDKAQMQQGLENRIANVMVFHNPRYVKKAYGYLQGIQAGVDTEHQKLVDLQKSEKEKAKTLQKAEKSMLLSFNDFSEKNKIITERIVYNPQQMMHQIVSQIRPMDTDNLTKKESDDLLVRVKVLFEQKNGMNYDEFVALSRQQTLSEIEQIVSPEQLGDDVRFEQADDVVVEKVDETTGIIHRK